MKKQKIAALYALLATALYAVNVPLSKILLNNVDEVIMAGLLYLGAGVGLSVYTFTAKLFGKNVVDNPLAKKDMPYIVAMVVLDIAAPILLMLGIKNCNSANVSLLNNFEIVATRLIAAVVFKELISKKLLIAISLVTISSLILSFEGEGTFDFSVGSLYVFGACLCWGVENNCTRVLSDKSSVQVTTVKGIFSGLGSLAVGFIVGQHLPKLIYVPRIMLLGFVSTDLVLTFISSHKNISVQLKQAHIMPLHLLWVWHSVCFFSEKDRNLISMSLSLL